jgi:hypothetical protein
MLPSTTVKSDAAAIHAMRNVMAQSGGEAAWKEIRSVEESFSILGAGEKTPHVMLLLDDWSLDTTRYRRKVQGQSSLPSDHNGAPTYPVKMGTSQVLVPEFDQARTLAGHLPGAAAEIMLRRKEYVLKISTSGQCDSGNICVDVLRAGNPIIPPIPEQRWTIALSNGLPVSVRIALPRVGNATRTRWEEVQYLGYAAESGLQIPVATDHIKANGTKETWTFVSLKKNCGFDTAKFDTEVAQ